jgi:hypothetical protein
LVSFSYEIFWFPFYTRFFGFLFIQYNTVQFIMLEYICERNSIERICERNSIFCWSISTNEILYYVNVGVHLWTQFYELDSGFLRTKWVLWLSTVIYEQNSMVIYELVLASMVIYEQNSIIRMVTIFDNTG